MADPQSRAPHIRLFNVKYSPNLGDGLLSECLESAILACRAGSARSIDLAARTGYTTGSHDRSLKLRVLEALPQVIRPLAVRLPLALAARRQWGPHYAAELAGGTCVVIGGGNLLADLDLNFPTKLALAIHHAARAGVPAFIYGCGVSSGWSARGKALMHDALATGAVRAVFLRDERSIALWDEMFGQRHALPARLVRDPGLMACDVYAPPATPADAPIGINITSQLAVRYHSDDAPTAEALDRFYEELAQALLAKGHRLTLFTNGSPEDRASLASLRPKLEGKAPAGQLTFPDARTPGELVGVIAGLCGLVAFRMHAIIAAFSCGVPFLALSWDPKLDSFVQSVGADSWLCKVTRSDGSKAAQQLASAMASGVDPAARAQVVAEARQGVHELFQAIGDALD